MPSLENPGMRNYRTGLIEESAFVATIILVRD